MFFVYVSFSFLFLLFFENARIVFFLNPFFYEEIGLFLCFFMNVFFVFVFLCFFYEESGLNPTREHDKRVQ